MFRSSGFTSASQGGPQRQFGICFVSGNMTSRLAVESHIWAVRRRVTGCVCGDGGSVGVSEAQIPGSALLCRLIIMTKNLHGRDIVCLQLLKVLNRDLLEYTVWNSPQCRIRSSCNP